MTLTLELELKVGSTPTTSGMLPISAIRNAMPNKG
jgi:hypothetical protein